MSPDAAIHLDLGTTEEYYGIPYTVVPASQPLVPITYGTGGEDYSDESDPGPMPIPFDAPIEGGSTADPDPSSGDRHVLVLQEGSCTLYELYNSERAGGGLPGELIGGLGSHGERHPPARLDLRRRGGPPDPARPPPLRRSVRRHDRARAPLHNAGHSARVHRAGEPLRIEHERLAPAIRAPRVRLKAGFDISGYSGAARDAPDRTQDVRPHPRRPGLGVVHHRHFASRLGGRTRPAARATGARAATSR